MKSLGNYTNGNYEVIIYDDGTKVRQTETGEFIPAFPESMDLKITNYCNMGCPYCHENSTVNGTHGQIMDMKFIDTVKPFTEMAIGGGNPLDHPDIESFLRKLKTKNIIANITVNQKHFLDNIDLLTEWTNDKLIYGLGVSLSEASEELTDSLSKFPNAVLHIIAGVITKEQFEQLYDKGIKLLVLGYKILRRGESYYNLEVEQNISMLEELLFSNSTCFEVISFDNLALRQLHAQDHIHRAIWEACYMGDDGQHTMYVDAVKEEYAVSSTSTERYNLDDDINTMFTKIRGEYLNRC